MAVPAPGHRDLSDDERRRRTTELLVLAARAERPEAAAWARSEVVELNLRVATAVARRYANRGVDLEDLEQTACEGLVKAVARFDVDQQNDLLTFAVPTIRGEVQRYFRDKSWSIRPRRQVQDVQRDINRFIDEFATRRSREPTAAETCVGLGISPRLHAEAVGAFGCFQPISINRRVGATDGTSELGDLIPDHHDDVPAIEARVVLRPLIRGLAERDRRIVFLRFYESRSQREIGDLLGIRQAQVSRVLDRIYDDLRRRIDDAGHGPGGVDDLATVHEG